MNEWNWSFEIWVKIVFLRKYVWEGKVRHSVTNGLSKISRNIRGSSVQTYIVYSEQTHT